MNVDFNAEITDALGRVQYEPEVTPAGLTVLAPAMEEDGVTPIMTTGPDGKSVPHRTPKVSAITLGKVCVTALTRAWPDEKLSEAVSFERFMLALKIAPGGVIDLTLSERNQIQTATDNWRSQAPVFMARARLMLDTAVAG